MSAIQLVTDAMQIIDQRMTKMAELSKKKEYKLEEYARGYIAGNEDSLRLLMDILGELTKES